MISFTDLFEKVSKPFIAPKPAVPLSQIREALGLDSDRYIAAEEGDDVLLLDCLGIDGLYHGHLSEPAIAAYSDPTRKTPVWVQNPPPDETGLGFPPDGEMGTSAAMLVSEYCLPFGRTALVAMVRTELGRFSLYRDTMVFGLYGTYGDDKNFKLKKILVPRIDRYGCMDGVREADLSNPAEINASLLFLSLCKSKIFEGSSLFARDVWKQLLRNSAPPSVPHVS